MNPTNLDQCFICLKDKLSSNDLKALATMPINELPRLHSTLGRWMRNEWGLWTGSDLSKYFNDLGLTHADDMSGLIIKSFVRHLQGLPLDVEDQIKSYQEYWRKHG